MNTIDGLMWLDHIVKLAGYTDAKPLTERPGHYGAIMRMLFTHAIIVGRFGDDHGYEDRWCYHTHADAAKALASWNGNGEPPGWHRHPFSGRRRDIVSGTEVYQP